MASAAARLAAEPVLDLEEQRVQRQAGVADEREVARCPC